MAEARNRIDPEAALAAPFNVNIWERHDTGNDIPNPAAGSTTAAANNNSSRTDVQLTALLPATRRTRRHQTADGTDNLGDDIVQPTYDLNFLESELLVKRLNDAQSFLWLCGRPMPPRPLHHQLLLKREITVTENPELHLVWSRGRIFLKPIPEWLLHPSFWTEQINATTFPDGRELLGNTPARLAELALCARGFLYSYCALIAYKSDFQIAKTRGLVPEEVSWDRWKTLSEQVLAKHRYNAVNPRYWYGELRLGRLNKVYMFRFGHLIRGYSTVDSAAVYMDLLHENFGILAALLAYIVVVLTAMQVGLGVDRLKDKPAFQNASYGFTVFSVISPLGGALAILLLALPIVAGNWIATKKYQKDRFRHMGIDKSENRPRREPREEEETSNAVSGPATV